LKKIESFSIGQTASYAKTMTETETYLGVGLIGAMNPVHIDKVYCSKTRFKEPIGVGLLVNALSVSTAQNCLLLCPSVLTTMDATFVAPVYFGDTIQANVEIIDLDKGKNLVSFKHEMKNQRNETVLVGKFTLRIIEEDKTNA